MSSSKPPPPRGHSYYNIEQCLGWIRRNWLLSFLILLLVMVLTAIIFFFALFTESCDDDDGQQRPSADIMLALDESLSMKSDEWEQAKEAARNYFDVFKQTLLSEKEEEAGVFQAGALEWSDDVTVATPLQPTIDDVLDVISGMTQSWGGGGTNLGPALLECINQFDTNGQDSAYRLCAVITDGQNRNTDVLDEPYCRKHPEDLQGNRCTAFNIATHMKEERDIHILGIFVCSRAWQFDDDVFGTPDHCKDADVVLGEIASCPNGNTADCLFFQRAYDLQDLRNGAEKLAVSISEMSCLASSPPSPLYLLPLLLLLLLPLLAAYCKRTNYVAY